MKKRQYSREKTYIVISIILSILGVLIILFSLAFSIQVMYQINDASDQLKNLNLVSTTGINEIISSLRRVNDNVSNGLFLVAVAALFVFVGTILQLITNRNFRELADEFLSQVEKYRQLLSVKKLLEAEGGNATKIISKLSSELEDSQQMIIRLEQEIEKLRKK